MLCTKPSQWVTTANDVDVGYACTSSDNNPGGGYIGLRFPFLNLGETRACSC